MAPLEVAPHIASKYDLSLALKVKHEKVKRASIPIGEKYRLHPANYVPSQNQKPSDCDCMANRLNILFFRNV